MKHSIDGIIISTPAPANRRSMLRWMLAGPALIAGFLSGRGKLVAGPFRPGRQTGGQGDPEVASKYGVYFVAPADIRRFDQRRRAEAGVLGDYMRGFPGRVDLARTHGFLAWLTEEQANELQAARDVNGVHAIGERDVIGPGRAPRTITKLVVSLHPNAWIQPPPHDTYFSNQQLADQWSREFGRSGVRFDADRFGNHVYVTVGRTVDDRLIRALARHPQVIQMSWTLPAATFGGGATTQGP